jgi:zinc resistance-associated protein
MRVKTFHIALIALAILAMTSSLALARPGGGPGAGQGGCSYMGGGMSQLTPEKQATFQKLRDAFVAKTAQLQAELGVKMAELNALSVPQNPDQAKIDALTKQIGDLQGKLLSERTQFRIQVTKDVGPGMGRGMRGGMGGGMMAGCPGGGRQ